MIALLIILALYICPMHPTYTSDRPGECPICGMTLVRVEEGEHERGGEPPGHSAIRVTPAQRQAIGVKVAKVAIRPLTKRIRTVGTVAFDPELAVAQREYISARRLGDRALWKAAEERLHIMGMSHEQIKMLAKSGRVQKNLYLPGPENKAWIYGMIYEVDIPYVKQGQSVEVSVPGKQHKKLSGAIAAIDPVLDPKTRTVTLRSEVDDPKGLLKPNQYVNVHIEIPLGKLLSIPSTALIWSDGAHFVFIDEGEGRLVPREVVVGKGAEEYVEIIRGLKKDELVVVQPNFLFDAESQLKATIKEMGGHKH